MLPLVTTRSLQTAIATKRRADAALRWAQNFRPGGRPTSERLTATRPLPVIPPTPANAG